MNQSNSKLLGGKNHTGDNQFEPEQLEKCHTGDNQYETVQLKTLQW